jgi:predicted O-linked N-acetylglucosamine transferase (SPINDLY family)
MADVRQEIEESRRLQNLGQIDRAEAILRRAVAKFPKDAYAHSALAALLGETRRAGQALFFAERAAALAPTNAFVLNTLGGISVLNHDYTKAVQVLCRAAAAAPNNAVIANTLGVALLQSHQNNEAAAQFDKALAMEPRAAGTWVNRARILAEAGRGDEAVVLLSSAVALLPNDVTILRDAALNTLYSHAATPAQLLAAHEAFGSLLQQRVDASIPPQSAAATDPPRGATDPIRIAFVSGDFREHSVASYLRPLLQHLDRNRFTVYGYNTAQSRDDTETPGLRALCDHYREVETFSAPALVRQAAADRIDLAVDLAGLTPGNRLDAFAAKLAPRQVTYLGYPATTGLRVFDARITDAIADPADHDAHGTEPLARLPGCFLCYSPPSAATDCSRDLSDPAAIVTFGSFNNSMKLNDRVIALWARVLLAVPNSRLILKSSGFRSLDVQNDLRARFAAQSVASDRIGFPGFTNAKADHLAQYRSIDIALDTFPYNGTTTTCEALWMGVPVITLAGQGHRARVGASLLTAVDRPEWIATDENQYADLATSLGATVQVLRSQRAQLRASLVNSPLCDAPAFARRFEALLTTLAAPR